MQILPGIIGGSYELLHNMKTATQTYMSLESFKQAFSRGKVKDISTYTHELRWVKSPAELSLMRESASIASQVTFISSVMHVVSVKLYVNLAYS